MAKSKKMKCRILGAAVLAVCVVISLFAFQEKKPEEHTPEAVIRKLEKNTKFQPLDSKNPTQGISLEEERLRLEAVGTYTGAYIEDGSDESVIGVGAIVVRNMAEEMLQIAEITIETDGGKTARFQITNLPAGASVLALESKKEIFSSEFKALKAESAVGFFHESSDLEDKPECGGRKGRLMLKNDSKDTYPLVYVYYKNKIEEDLYLGGITYRVPFEQVPAQTQVESEAGHYSPEISEIVDIEVKKEVVQ